MQNARVFGKLPENPQNISVKSIKAVEPWRFVSPDGQEIPVEAEEPQEFTAEVAQEEIDALRRDLAETDDAELSVDLPLKLTTAGQHWTSGGVFSNRSGALAAMGSQRADAGTDVGVIVLDAGFNRDYIETLVGPGHYGGGWSNRRVGAATVGHLTDSHMRTEDLHGNMIARNILSVAPNVTLYDAPVLPPRVYNLHGFSSDVVGALRAIRRVIRNRHNNPNFPTHTHWILCNAWAVATSFADHSSTYPYASSRRHRLNAHVIRLAEMDNVDVVFAAGNSGAFAPAAFTGPYDRGHGHAIWGANGLEEVFTIGAVRADGIPVGMSAQGPSRDTLMVNPGVNRKPEMVLPSWFAEDMDPGVLNTGTSAASGLFAGLLADIRSGGDMSSSADLKQVLMDGATAAGQWNAQRGVGLPKYVPAMV